MTLRAQKRLGSSHFAAGTWALLPLLVVVLLLLPGVMQGAELEAGSAGSRAWGVRGARGGRGRRLLFAGETDPCYKPARYGSETECTVGEICPNGEGTACTLGRPSPICLFVMRVDGTKFGCSWWNALCWSACAFGSHDGMGYRREYCNWHGVPKPTAFS